MQIFLAVSPCEERSAMQYTRSIAHAAYRIGPESTLLRQNLLQSRGGLLSISDGDTPPISDPAALCAAVKRECSRRDYSGVLLDFEKPLREDYKSFVRRLREDLYAVKRTLFVPENCAAAAPGAVTILCTAISGGNFREYLEGAIKRLGADHVALDAQRLRMIFPLPCPSGQGTPLSREELRALLDKSPSVFFSPELCCRYFTFTRQGQTCFVLFDDAGTMRQKLDTAAALGISTAFFLWPEVEDIAGEIPWQA